MSEKKARLSGHSAIQTFFSVSAFRRGVGMAVFLLSCKSQDSNSGTIIFRESQESEIMSFDNNISKVKLCRFNDSLISAYDGKQGKIYVYNHIRGRLRDSFDIMLKSGQRLFNYEVIDDDHVLLAFNPTYLGDQHDSAICIINKEKSILRVFSFRGTEAPLYNEENPYKYRETTWWYSIPMNFSMAYNSEDSSVITTLAPFHAASCDSVAENTKPVVYRLYSDERMADPLPYHILPCTDRLAADERQDLNAIPYGTMDADNTPVIGYAHSSQLSHGGQIYEPGLLLYDLADENTSLKYLRIIYDPYRKCYWWVINIRFREYDPHKHLQNAPLHYIARLNQQFEVEAEGFLPGEYSEDIVPMKQGLLMYNKQISDTTGQKQYSIFQADVLDGWDKEHMENMLKQKRQFREKDINGLLDHLMTQSPVPSVKKLLLISLDRMPPNYAREILDRIENSDIGHLSVHIFTNNPDNIPEELMNKVQVHSYPSISRYIDPPVWPAIYEWENSARKDIQIKEYPTSQVNNLLKELERD